MVARTHCPHARQEREASCSMRVFITGTYVSYGEVTMKARLPRLALPNPSRSRERVLGAIQGVAVSYTNQSVAEPPHHPRTQSLLREGPDAATRAA